MNNGEIFVGYLFLILVIGFIIYVLFSKRKKWNYSYKRKEYFMTRTEHECFNALISTIGHTYYIFPQAHLPTFLDYKIMGQKWSAAFFHISQKSVDFVICDKINLSPLLAIELDDKSHEHLDRQLRDKEVERICQQANMPLLRITNKEYQNQNELLQVIQQRLPN